MTIRLKLSATGSGYDLVPDVMTWGVVDAGHTQLAGGWTLSSFISVPDSSLPLRCVQGLPSTCCCPCSCAGYWSLQAGWRPSSDAFTCCRSLDHPGKLVMPALAGHYTHTHTNLCACMRASHCLLCLAVLKDPHY